MTPKPNAIILYYMTSYDKDPAWLQWLARGMEALENLDENPDTWPRRLAWLLLLPVLMAMPLLRGVLVSLEAVAQFLMKRPKRDFKRNPVSPAFWRFLAVLLSATAACWVIVALRALEILEPL